MTAPFKLKPNSLALVMACLSASTREVCPTPEANSCESLLNTMVLDLVCLHTFAAKTKASSSFSLGARVVATVKSALPSVARSLSCSMTPFKRVLIIFVPGTAIFWSNRIRFFLVVSTAKASGLNAGAINTSKKREFISSAAARSTGLLVTSTPPKAEVVSAAKAFW